MTMSWTSAQRETTERRDIAAELTERIATLIEQTGKVPWKREWDPAKCAGPQAPVNAFTGELYHGINALMFGLDARPIISGDPRWATFKQAQDAGCHITKGAKAVLGVFYKPLEIEDDKAEDGKRTIPLLKTFHVFHATEIAGLPSYEPPSAEAAPWTRPEAVTLIMQNSGAAFRIGGDRAFYSPAFDTIQMPPDAAFERREYWAATVIHEINHSTGHPSRMNRDLSHKFGSDAYACEEARVEMAACFVCNTLNLPTDFENHAAYVAGWLSKLREDKRELLRAAADAQKIADWTLCYHPNYAARHGTQPERPVSSSPPLRPELRPET